MELEYQLTEADILALMRFRYDHISARHNPITIRRLGYTIGFIFMSAGGWLLSNNLILPITFLAMAVIAFIGYPTYFDWLMRRKVTAAFRDPNRRATLGPRTIRVTSEGIEQQSSEGQIKVNWNVVDGIVPMPTFTVVSIHNVPSIIIPENQIIAGDYEGFVEACRQFYNQETDRPLH